MLSRELSVRSATNIAGKRRDQGPRESQAEDPKEKEKDVIIGIDYGTSFSGAAYAIYPRRRRELRVSTISDWPHAHSYHRASQKVPSDLGYDADGKVYCGFDIPEDCQRLKWVKLLLETDYDEGKAGVLQTEEVLKSREHLSRLNKTPIRAAADYLKWLWDLVCEMITEEQRDPHLLANSNVTVMLTVPAIWSDAAKDNTLQAAELAGICDGRTIKFITEPEAAAISELQRRISQGHLDDGDCVIICDAGGGTVDLVSYQIKSIDPLELRQVVVVDGGLCGSAWIDHAFLSQVKSIMQSDWDKISPLAQEEIKDTFAYTIKPKFESLAKARKETISVNSDGRALVHVQNGRIVVQPETVHLAFDVVIPQILSLIDDQVDSLIQQDLRQNLKGILLVGGLGSSRFVHSRIEQNFAKDENILVWRSQQSWCSIVEGAVTCAFMSLGNIQQVESRKARYSYGVPFHPPFDRSKHRSEDMFTCPFEGIKKAKQILWLVRKGQKINATDPPQVYKFIKVVCSADGDAQNYTTGFSLVQSDQDDAPEHITERVKDYVNIECSFTQEMLDGSWHKSLRQNNEPGKSFWKVEVALEVRWLPAQIMFQCLLDDQPIVSTQVFYGSNEKPRTTLYNVSESTTPTQAQFDRRLSMSSSASSARRYTSFLSNGLWNYSTSSLPSLSTSSATRESVNPHSQSSLMNANASTLSFITFDSVAFGISDLNNPGSDNASILSRPPDDTGSIINATMSGALPASASKRRGSQRSHSKTISSTTSAFASINQSKRVSKFLDGLNKIGPPRYLGTGG